MKYAVMIMLFCMHNVNSQNNSKTVTKWIKKDTMEYFNIDKYKDWETDTDYSLYEDSKFLKKENKRVKIYYDKDGILVYTTDVTTPYSVFKGFSNETKKLTIIGDYFGTFSIGTDKEYDENGRVIKEINYDEPYKFTLQQVIEKIKKEEQIDLEDNSQGGVLSRFVDEDLNNKPIYKVSLKSKESKAKRDYLIIDGNTGESLFRTTRYFPPDDMNRELPPYDEYLKGLKKKQQEDNAYYKTYKGKDYTKKEWEAFEEEWYKNYKENKDKGFWDDIFPGRSKK